MARQHAGTVVISEGHKEVVNIRTAGAASKCSAANVIRIRIQLNSLKLLFGTPLLTVAKNKVHQRINISKICPHFQFLNFFYILGWSSHYIWRKILQSHYDKHIISYSKLCKISHHRHLKVVYYAIKQIFSNKLDGLLTNIIIINRT